MISEGTESFVLMHRSGRYLDWRLFIPTDSAGCHIPGEPMYYTYRLISRVTETWEHMSRHVLERFLEQERFDPDQFIIKPRPVCACCGDEDIVKNADGYYSPYRCAKHRHWNPCIVEGCKRVRVAPVRADGRAYLANNQVICSEHWRRYAPPHSKVRRTYLRFWRIAKRQATPANPDGWDEALDRRFRRFWRGLVAQIRRKATEGHLDEAEIHKLFGWDQPEG
jgi:hypothetical protein